VVKCNKIKFFCQVYKLGLLYDERAFIYDVTGDIRVHSKGIDSGTSEFQNVFPGTAPDIEEFGP
jgi:hypothetical protein